METARLVIARSGRYCLGTYLYLKYEPRIACNGLLPDRYSCFVCCHHNFAHEDVFFRNDHESNLKPANRMKIPYLEGAEECGNSFLKAPWKAPWQARR